MTINIGPGIKIGTGVTITTPILTAIANTAEQIFYTGGPISTFIPLVAKGGSNTYSYQIISGSLPTGLTYNPATGIINGTPTTLQSASVVSFTVYDSVGYCAANTSTVSFTVYNPLTATATTTAQILETTVAMTTFTPLVASGGSGGYVYSYTGTLPAGLNYNTSTGAITGTPTATFSTCLLYTSPSPRD